MLPVLVIGAALLFLAARKGGAAGGSAGGAPPQSKGGAAGPDKTLSDIEGGVGAGVSLVGSGLGVYSAIANAFGGGAGGGTAGGVGGGTTGGSVAIEGTATASTAAEVTEVAAGVSSAAVIGALQVVAFFAAWLAALFLITVGPILSEAADFKSYLLSQGFNGVFDRYRAWVQSRETSILEELLSQAGATFTRDYRPVVGIQAGGYQQGYLTSVSGVSAVTLKILAMIARVSAIHEVAGYNRAFYAYYQNEWGFSAADIEGSVYALSPGRFQEFVNTYYAENVTTSFGVLFGQVNPQRHRSIASTESFDQQLGTLSMFSLRFRQSFFSGQLRAYYNALDINKRLTIFDGQWGTPNTDLVAAQSQTPWGHTNIAATNRVFEFGWRQVNQTLYDDQARLGFAPFQTPTIEQLPGA